MNKLRSGFCVALFSALFLIGAARAQGPALTLSFARDFGYSSGGGDIQGLFTITASGPANLTRVVFYIDDEILGEVDQPPFKLQFSTDDYTLGRHQFHAVGTTSDGAGIESQTIDANFVTAQEGLRAGLRIAVPILVVVAIAMLASALIPVLTGSEKADLPPGAQRSYPLGGSICPKCGRPFGLHLYGFNLLGSKLDRCPYCGKWSAVRRASMAQLRAAEQAELARGASENSGEVGGMSEAEKLKKELDESKYRDM